MNQIILVLCFCLISSFSFAGGTCAVTEPSVFSLGDTTIKWSCTADSADGSFPASATTSVISGRIEECTTNPGATAPTDNYDITITDADSGDIMGGAMANRDTTTTEYVVPLVGGAYKLKIVKSILTLNITNNAVNSAIVVVKCTIVQ